MLSHPMISHGGCHGNGQMVYQKTSILGLSAASRWIEESWNETGGSICHAREEAFRGWDVFSCFAQQKGLSLTSIHLSIHLSIHRSTWELQKRGPCMSGFVSRLRHLTTSLSDMFRCSKNGTWLGVGIVAIDTHRDIDVSIDVAFDTFDIPTNGVQMIHKLIWDCNGLSLGFPYYMLIAT